MNREQLLAAMQALLDTADAEGRELSGRVSARCRGYNALGAAATAGGDAGGDAGGGLTVNQYITTPDANSFRASRRQTQRDARRGLGV